MKYMGSKRYMLNNGLAVLLKQKLIHAKRFVDPFAGAGSVAHFVSEHFKIPVLASDLQTYSSILTGAIIERTVPYNADSLSQRWILNATKKMNKSSAYNNAMRIENKLVNISAKDIPAFVKSARAMCKCESVWHPIYKAYGGYYFSPYQALTFDFLRKCVPREKPAQTICLAALIMAASKCAAAPGHTAQPFQPTRTAGRFLIQSWKLDPLDIVKKSMQTICPRHAKTKGKAVVADIFDIIKRVKSSDLVLLDPPYSGVQYSRFYHVLETISRGDCGPVMGTGRYPDIRHRPQSTFSNISQSIESLERMFSLLARSGANIIITFPKGKCSNGLSGNIVIDISKKYFTVRKKLINGYFSTLGGNNKPHNRKYRKISEELLLFLEPRNHRW